MLCKLCEKERCISKHFRHYANLHICDDCGEMMGYDYTNMVESVRDRVDREVGSRIDRAVQRSLPHALEQIMVENELTFELKVV